MSRDHHAVIAAHVTPVPDRPNLNSATNPVRAYVEWLEERLAFAYEYRDSLFADISRAERASEANFKRWQAAQQKLAKIELILNPPPEAGAAGTDTGTSG